MVARSPSDGRPGGLGFYVLGDNATDKGQLCGRDLRFIGGSKILPSLLPGARRAKLRGKTAPANIILLNVSWYA